MPTVSTPCSACAPHAVCKKAGAGLHYGRQAQRASFTTKHQVEVFQNTATQLWAPVSACLAVATALALNCPQALAVDGPTMAQASSSLSHSQNPARNNYSAADIGQVAVARGLSAGPDQANTSLAGQDAPDLVITGLADAATTPDILGPPESMATGTYVPGPVEVGWQIYVGSAVAAFPFFLGAYEFGKRILIQQRCATRSWTQPVHCHCSRLIEACTATDIHRAVANAQASSHSASICRCEKCGGNGLLKSGRFYRKCPECGGFFPWQGWKLFFTSTASPGNGGPLLQPRGQKSVLYKVPPKKPDEEKVAETVSSSSKSSSSGPGDGDGGAP